MYVWDQQVIVTADIFCPIRAYLHYTSTALMYHSYILQAIQRYCRIKGLNVINTRTRQLLLVIIQWIIAFTFDLPILLTGRLNILLSDNICFLPLYEMGFTIYMAFVMFGLPNIAVTLLYRNLVSHVRSCSSTMTVASKKQINRDLTMVRRVVLLVSLLIFSGIPFCIFAVLSWIDSSRLPSYHLHVAFITLNGSLPIMLISLIWLTPDLRQSLLHATGMIRPQPQAIFTITHRVVPAMATAQS